MIQKVLPASLKAPEMARRVVAGQLRKYPSELAEAAVLLVSEVVTNSVRHGGLNPGDSITLSLQLRSDVVRVEVTDGGRGFRWSGPQGDPSEGASIGLRLVEQLSERWGVRQDPCSVWFELPAGLSDRSALGL
jgi:anti-sigma regulatory factor (Ser/Thr protein kinase)